MMVDWAKLEDEMLTKEDWESLRDQAKQNVKQAEFNLKGLIASGHNWVKTLEVCETKVASYPKDVVDELVEEVEK